MPIRHTIDKTRALVEVEVYGTLTTDDILRTLDAVAADPDFEPGFDVLSDHTRIEEPITTEQLKQMTGHLGSLARVFAGTRWAVVAAKPASFGMMKMLSVHARQVPIDVRVFGSRSDAEEWLAARRSRPDAKRR